MPLLGSGIDPSLFRQDYSGFVNAANTDANSIMALGNKLSGATDDYFKKQSDDKKLGKENQKYIESAINLFPELADRLKPVQDQLKDENQPLSDKIALGNSVRDLLKLRIGQNQQESDNRFRDRQLGIQEASANSAARVNDFNFGQSVSEAARQNQQYAMDDQTKATIGPGMLDSVLAMSPKGIRDDVAKKVASGDYTDAEKYSLANSMMGLIPKKERAAAPTVQEVAVPGGTQKMQWDETSGAFIPIRTGDILVPPAVSPDATRPDLPTVYNIPGTEPDGMVLPPKQEAPTRPGFTPTPVNQAEIDKKAAADKEAIAAKETAQAAVDKSQDFIGSLNKLENHPGFNGLFGVGLGAKHIPGTDASDASVLLDQIKGKGFLEAIGQMKGMGALSDTEGLKLSAAFLGMDPGMSESAAKSQIEEIKGIIQRGIDKAKAKGITPIQGSQAPAIDPKKAASAFLQSNFPIPPLPTGY